MLAKRRMTIDDIPDDLGNGSEELEDASLDGVLIALGDLEMGGSRLCLEPVTLDSVLEVDRG
jgi:hypothetical protein